jgi:hypothetical protein
VDGCSNVKPQPKFRNAALDVGAPSKVSSMLRALPQGLWCLAALLVFVGTEIAGAEWPLPLFKSTEQAQRHARPIALSGSIFGAAPITFRGSVGMVVA